MEQKELKKIYYKHRISCLLNVRQIVTIHYQSLDKYYVAKEEKHDFWEMIYVDKGRVFIINEESRIVLNSGEVYFIKPNNSHYVKCENNEPNIFILSFDCHSNAMDALSNKKCYVNNSDRYLLENIMTEAIQTFYIPDFDPDLNELIVRDDPKFGGEQIIKNSLELFLINLLREKNDQQIQKQYFVSKLGSSSNLEDEIIKVLNDKIYGNFELDDLCKKIHYGKTRLCTYFQKKTGISIYKMYQQLKINEAKKLIRKGKAFAEITDLLFFDSSSHFNATFKKITGMTPGDYKRSIK